MARQRKTTSSARSSTPPPGSIRDFYKLGTDFLKATGGERSPGAAEELAEKRQYSQVTLYKARQFAEMYSQDELKELCSLRQPDGKPLGIGHVHQLIQVKAPGDRKSLQKAAAKNCWSSRKLKEKRKLKERRKLKFDFNATTNRGRKPRRAANADEALLHLAQRADQWLRWVDALTPSPLGELPEGVRDKLKAATNAIQDLSETLQRSNIRKRNSRKRLQKSRS